MLLFAGTIIPVQASPLLAIDGKHFIDPSGARVILRGYAIQAKMPPFRPVSAAEDLDVIVEHGANVIRLHFSWEAAEPTEGVYDENYFSYYRQVVDWAAERNIFVIIDFHNNAFSRWAADGCGSGFPPWAVTPEVSQVQPQPNGACNFSQAMGKAIFTDSDNYKIWKDFLSNAYGARTRFFNLLRRLASDYKNHPSVIGFDLNEPLPWNNSTNTFEYEMMALFYEAMGTIAHNIDPTMFIFVEPFFIDHILFNRTTPYRPLNIENMVYAPHFYEFGSLHYGYPIFFHSPSLASIVTSQEKLNAPVLIGEWGAKMNGAQSIEDQLNLIVRDFDKYGFSATRWNYSPNWTPEEKDHFHEEDYSCFDDTRTLREGCFPRAYVQRISGEPTSVFLFHRGESFIFVPQNPSLSERYRLPGTYIELKWMHDPQKGETVLFVPISLLYDSTPEIITQGVSCTFDTNQIYLRCASAEAGHKRVFIRP